MLMHMANNFNTRKKPVPKGVGGFRPVVNWRKITVRRRTIEDCKVIKFIVTSGILIIIIGLIITILGFFVVNSKCPTGWQGGTTDCLKSVGDNATYDQAKLYCAENDASLPYIYSDELNDRIMDIIAGPSWLALRKPKNATDFTWPATGLTPNFTKWRDGAPAAVPATEHMCVEMMTTGLWRTLVCSDSSQVTCLFIPKRNPLVLVGPVLMGCGLLVLILSIEVCIRRHQFYVKNRGLLIDEDDLLEKTPAEGLPDSGYKNPAYSSPTAGGATKRAVDPWQASPRPRPLAKNKTVPVLVTPRKEISRSSVSLPQAEKSPARDLVEASGSPRSLPVPSNSNDSSSSQEQLELILTPKAL